MKVKDLIKQLQEFDQEIECYVYADHGQTNIQLSGAYIEKIKETQINEYCVDTTHEDDMEEYKKYINVCVISD